LREERYVFVVDSSTKYGLDEGEKGINCCIPQQHSVLLNVGDTKILGIAKIVI
jgi:hypothetical protein